MAKTPVIVRLDYFFDALNYLAEHTNKFKDNEELAKTVATMMAAYYIERLSTYYKHLVDGGIIDPTKIVCECCAEKTKEIN